MTLANLRAVIVYAHTDLLPRAYRHCAGKRYNALYLVPTSRWSDAQQLIDSGKADLIVAASADSLDPQRLPRVEVVPDEEPDADD